MPLRQKLRPMRGLEPLSPRCTVVPNHVRLLYWWHSRVSANDPDRQAGFLRDWAGACRSALVPDIVGAHTAYVERTNLTRRQMNGRLVRKILSYSKQLDALRASCAWEDWVVGLQPSTQGARDPGA